MHKTNVFIPGQIIKRFKVEAFNEIPKHDLMDFVCSIYPRDEAILETWEDHFRGLKIPYVITKDQDKNTKSLWKERRV